MFSHVFLFSLIAATFFIGSWAAQHTCLNYYEQKHLNDDMKKLFEQEKKLIMDFICEKVDAVATVATHTKMFYMILGITVGCIGTVTCCYFMKKTGKYNVLNL